MPELITTTDDDDVEDDVPLGSAFKHEPQSPSNSSLTKTSPERHGKLFPVILDYTGILMVREKCQGNVPEIWKRSRNFLFVSKSQGKMM